MATVLHWFRRDLRLNDNAALHAACAAADCVLPIFIFDPKILLADDIGAPRVAFLLACLAALEKEIEHAGGRLIVRHGPVEKELARLLHETGASALYYNRDYEPYARERDAKIEKQVRDAGSKVHSFKDGVIFEADEVVKADGSPYCVFTPYSRLWRTRELPVPLPKAKFHPPHAAKYPHSDPLPTLRQLGFSCELTVPEAGAAAAEKQLRHFASKPVLQYGTQRNYPACEGTSRLSYHLRFGTLSPRTIVAAARKAAEAHPEGAAQAEIYITEIIWRDFYRQILWHFPHVATAAFKPDFNDLAWENNDQLFRAWCEGRTGYPIVDAGMRQLNTTGWMHNRLRMIVAAFLTKDLLISWQWGERYFMQRLWDGDLASNNGGWQWSASTGTDAQPYFRVFNPSAQADRFDPEGAYTKRYVPEIGSPSYPKPIVDHAVQRPKAIALFQTGARSPRTAKPPHAAATRS